jgi:hypothetical protein
VNQLSECRLKTALEFGHLFVNEKPQGMAGHGPAPLKGKIWIALMWGRAMPGPLPSEDGCRQECLPHRAAKAQPKDSWQLVKMVGVL